MNKSPNRTTRMERFVLACTSIGFLFLSGGVIACIFYLLLLMAPLVMARPAAAQPTPVTAGVRLEAGIEMEDVDGDLKSAMDIYQKIAADTSAPRDVRAKALLRLAGCDEKLGKQARQVYEQIVHDYADQPAAAQARQRLASLKKQENPATPTTMSVRKIEWAGLGEMTACDTDGHRAIYRATDGNLYFGDLTGQNKRLVFKVQPGDVPGWCASRDLSMAALSFAPKPSRTATLAVIKNDGTGYRELVHDDAKGTILGGASGFHFDWSWDARRLLIWAGWPQDGEDLRIVDVADGHRRELLRLQSGCIAWAVFSPDGRFVAYETWPHTPGANGAWRIYVVPAEGGESRLAYETNSLGVSPTFGADYPALKDWTADGRFLAIRDVRQGKSALYLLPVKNGAASGSPEFVRYGDFDDAYAVLSGALVYQDMAATSSDMGAYLGSVDPGGSIGNWRSLDVRGGLNGGYPWPSFSPDGNRIAYSSGDVEPKHTNLIVQDISSGEQRVVYQSTNGSLACRYSNREPKIFCSVTGREGGTRTDLIAVNDKSGAIERIGSLSGSKAISHYPDDGKTFFFVDVADKFFQVTRWDLDTQQETVVVPGPQNPNLALELPSFDGRFLLRVVEGDGMSVRPIAGGDWKTLVSGVKTLSSSIDTTHDGDFAFYAANDSEGRPGLFRISTAGGKPERVGDLPVRTFQGYYYFSADGRQILGVNFNDNKYDLWVLENFEPSDKK
jgi:Tol biopolymer transport system component